MAQSSATIEGAELERLLAQVPSAEESVIRWTAELEQRQALAAEVAGNAGASAFADPDTVDVIAERLAVARAGVDVAASALQEARAQLLAAQRATFRARAAELRAEAQTLRDAADVRQTKTDTMIAALQEFEDGATYVEFAQWMTQYRTVPGDRPLCLPKTTRIRNRADARDREAGLYDDRASTGDLHNFPAWVDTLTEQVAAARAAEESEEEQPAAEPVAA